MKVGFDVHGVLDTYSEIIIPMMKLLLHTGNEICIVSGPPEKHIKKDLQKIGLEKEFPNTYIHIFSVVDFLKNSGVKTWKDKKGNVWTDEQNWWDSKAKICKQYQIDYIIDDSEKYRSAFDLTNCKFIHIDDLMNWVRPKKKKEKKHV